MTNCHLFIVKQEAGSRFDTLHLLDKRSNGDKSKITDRKFPTISVIPATLLGEHSLQFRPSRLNAYYPTEGRFESVWLVNPSLNKEFSRNKKFVFLMYYAGNGSGINCCRNFKSQVMNTG